MLWASLVANVTFVSVPDPLPTLGTLGRMVTLGTKTAASRLANLGSASLRRDVDSPEEATR